MPNSFGNNALNVATELGKKTDYECCVEGLGDDESFSKCWDKDATVRKLGCDPATQQGGKRRTANGARGRGSSSGRSRGSGRGSSSGRGRGRGSSSGRGSGSGRGSSRGSGSRKGERTRQK